MAGNETPSNRPESQSAPSDKPKSAGRSALDLMDELESYLKQVKSEQGVRPRSQPAPAEPAPPKQPASEPAEVPSSRRAPQIKPKEEPQTVDELPSAAVEPAPSKPSAVEPVREKPQGIKQNEEDVPPALAEADQAHVQHAQAWLTEHSEALDERQRSLEEQTTALEIERDELKNMRVRLSQEGMKLQQHRKVLAQEKNKVAKMQKKLKEKMASVQVIPAQPGEAGGASGVDQEAETAAKIELEKQQKQILVHKRQLEQSWTALKREKALLVRRQRELEAMDDGELGASGGKVSQDRLLAMQSKLQKQYQELRAGEAVVDLARQQYAELLEQRQTLLEAKRFLTSVEKEMMRRWSVHRSVGLVGGAVSCLLFILLFSYGVGQRIVKPTWRASTVIGVTMSVFDESSYGDAWLTKQHQLMVGDEMLEEAVRLGAQRGVRIFEDVGAMRDALTRGLVVTLLEPGKMTLELRHTNPVLAVDVLDSLGRAFINHHTMEDRIAGRPNSMRTFQASARDPQPVEDDRLMASVVAFVVTFVFVALMALIFRWWLSRAIGIFESQSIPELEELDDSDRWPEEAAREAGAVGQEDEEEIVEGAVLSDSALAEGAGGEGAGEETLEDDQSHAYAVADEEDDDEAIA